MLREGGASSNRKRQFVSQLRWLLGRPPSRTMTAESHHRAESHHMVSLLGLHMGGADHLAPLLGFIRNELAELAGRAPQRDAPQAGPPPFHRGIGRRRL